MNRNYENESQRDLVEQLKLRDSIASKEVEQAILQVDRADFTSLQPYADSPQQIGYNVTISAPHMHAFGLKFLQQHLISGKPCKVLDIGCGSGYFCAALLSMIPPQHRSKSVIVGIDHIPELVQLSERNLRKSFSNALDQRNIVLVTGDGRQGYQPLAPYDAIHVGAATEKIPQALIDQLNLGGRMLIPVGKQREVQHYLAIDKDLQGKLTQRNLLEVQYVPLTSIHNQLNKM